MRCKAQTLWTQLAASVCVSLPLNDKTVHPSSAVKGSEHRVPYRLSSMVFTSFTILLPVASQYLKIKQNPTLWWEVLLTVGSDITDIYTETKSHVKDKAVSQAIDGEEKGCPKEYPGACGVHLQRRKRGWSKDPASVDNSGAVSWGHTQSWGRSSDTNGCCLVMTFMLSGILYFSILYVQLEKDAMEIFIFSM